MTTELQEFFAHQGLRHDAAAAPSTGNTTACVVALPRAIDPINLVGDEQKHATLLFAGETSTLPADAKTTFVETLQNVAQLFTPFAESITDISRLGSDNPPALVAMLTASNLNNIRQALLINPKIGEYLQNVTQHPSYMPHVTLAYPDYQGEAELRKVAAQLFRVRFDRLALWWGDEQIEFSLEMSDNAMAQQEKLEAFLAHHGIKGMKWGVRRSDTSLDSAAGRPADPIPKGTPVRTRIAMKLASPGTVIARPDGKTFIKKKDGSWGETKLSSEAEHLVKARQTPVHEMSNKDLNDAIARARLLEDYDKFFNNQPDRQMKAAVDKMQLQKNYSQLHAEFNPSKRKKAAEFIAGAAGTYVAYKKLDKASGGALGKGVRGGLVRAGMRSTGKHAIGAVAKDASKGIAKAAVKDVVKTVV